MLSIMPATCGPDHFGCRRALVACVKGNGGLSGRAGVRVK